MDQWTALAWGVLGFAASELSAGYLYYRATNRIPERYEHRGFWLLFLLLAAVVGLLIVAIEPEKPIQASGLAALMPLLINRARRFGRSWTDLDRT